MSEEAAESFGTDLEHRDVPAVKGFFAHEGGPIYLDGSAVLAGTPFAAASYAAVQMDGDEVIFGGEQAGAQQPDYLRFHFRVHVPRRAHQRTQSKPSGAERKRRAA